MLWEDRGSGNVRVQLISSLGEEPQPEGSNAAAGTNMTSDTIERQDDLFVIITSFIIVKKSSGHLGTEVRKMYMNTLCK